MRYQRVAGLIAVVGLAACGGASENSSDATTTAPASTVEVTTTPPATPEASTTEASTTTSTIVSERAFELYEQVDLPVLELPGSTEPVQPGAPLADGLYIAAYRGGDSTTPNLLVDSLAFWASSPHVADDPATPADESVILSRVDDPTNPQRDVSDLPFADEAYITITDSATQFSHWVTPEELANIYAGAPSAEAPDGYEFTPYFFLMVLDGGQITTFMQFWQAG